MAAGGHAQGQTTLNGQDTAGRAARRETGDLGIRRARLPETGVRVSETGVLHVGVKAESGWDSNVFFDSDQEEAAGILRITPFIEFTNARRDGEQPRAISYNLNAGLQFQEFLSDDPIVRDQRAFNPSFNGEVAFGPNDPLTFTLADKFSRIRVPPYSRPLTRVGGVTRISNQAYAQVRWAPGGGRLQTVLRYTFGIDRFGQNSGFNFANSMSHEGLLDISWKWLPKTAFFVRFSQGLIAYAENNANLSTFDSRPLRASLGVRGLLTPKIS